MRNNKYKLTLLLIFYFFPLDLICSIGCMDNSFHMECCYAKKKNCPCCHQCCDIKKLHYDHCTCPCTDIIDSRGKCRKCLHFGNPDRGIINMRLKERDFYFQ